MADKKDRGRFTLRLNENDPAHAEVIRLLEQQEPHSKGRFIANAVLHYARCSETPDVSISPSLDRMAVEKIILDILRQQGLDIKEPEPVPCPAEQAEPEEKKTSRTEPVADEPIKSDVDESTRALIQNTLFAFRSNS